MMQWSSNVPTDSPYPLIPTAMRDIYTSWIEAPALSQRAIVDTSDKSLCWDWHAQGLPPRRQVHLDP